MNKNIIRNSIIILVTVLITSCNDDFLERAPIVSISDGNFWKTRDDLRLYANQFYNNNGLLPLLNTHFYTGIYSIDGYDGSDTQIRVDYNRRMNGEGTVPATGGGWSWETLRLINYFMDNYQKSTEPFDNLKDIVGEVQFFRALFYFNQLKRFGDIPYTSSVVQIDSDILYESRLPRDQVVDSIMRDLDNAVENLPERTGTWTGQVTKETAMALQARIALYEGTWEKYHGLKNTPFKAEGSDGSRFIRKAAEVSGALIALAEKNGNTALANVGVANGYFNLFNLSDYSANKEVLFWRKFSVADRQVNIVSAYTQYGNGSGVTKRMVDYYLCADGKPIAASPLYQGESDLKSVVANRDPRLNQTICVDDGNHPRWISPEEIFEIPMFVGNAIHRCATGYQLYKGHNPNAFAEARSEQCVQGLIYFRYAEALLIYAEARAELGEITQSDIDKTINALRRRVGMNDGLLDMNNITPDPNWDFKDISPLLNEIRRERTVELACEGFRVDDIFRWAAADVLIAGYIPQGAVWEQWRDYPGADQSFLDEWAKLPVDNAGYIAPYKNYPGVSAGYQFNLGRDYLLPIPTYELTLNPKLGQNPGWQ